MKADWINNRIALTSNQKRIEKELMRSDFINREDGRDQGPTPVESLV
jgi:hypothetical protein